MGARLSLRCWRMLFCALFIAGLTLFWATESQATIMRYLEVEDLTKISSDVFRGKVLSTQANWNAEHTRIYTAIEVQIEESLKGAVRAGEVVTIVQLGGTVNGMSLEFEGRPQFAVGESVVLFTTRTRRSALTVVALKQGKMQVQGDEVVRDFAGITLIDKSASGKVVEPIQPKRTRLSLRELRQRVAQTK